MIEFLLKWRLPRASTFASRVLNSRRVGSSPPRKSAVTSGILVSSPRRVVASRIFIASYFDLGSLGPVVEDVGTACRSECVCSIFPLSSFLRPSIRESSDTKTSSTRCFMVSSSSTRMELIAAPDRCLHLILTFVHLGFHFFLSDLRPDGTWT
jgi:hypothetical protein